MRLRDTEVSCARKEKCIDGSLGTLMTNLTGGGRKSRVRPPPARGLAAPRMLLGLTFMLSMQVCLREETGTHVLPGSGRYPVFPASSFCQVQFVWLLFRTLSPGR